MLTPDVFDTAARRAGFTLDADQRTAAGVLAELDPRGGRGIYLWGRVGRGKTWMVDTLRGALPEVRTRRVHFHEFFRRLHTLAHTDGVTGALDRMLEDCDVLFFDEFHVHDVADGRLLARLLDALDTRGVTLVVTSNYPPHGLMPNPLYHDGFLPTIARLERRLAVLNLTGARDHRLGTLSGGAGFASGEYRTGPYELPDGAAAVTLSPCGRPLRALADQGGTVWFDFADLCEVPSGAADYLALAADRRCWIVSGLPAIEDASEFGVQRFCTLVDVLHDRDVPLTVIGADWRTGSRLGVPDVRRAASRLSLLASVS
ncbi:cell division protein ZapE [Rhodococcus sp. NPDC003318]|uniref:cell division protein ZapE n=1 Tax=Rhodococcus sp. NPDC003318 TaxID=3364503 RepID=UPI0036A1FC3D